MTTKTCTWCGRIFEPAVRGARRESPSAFRIRRTCSLDCRIALSRKRHVSDDEVSK